MSPIVDGATALTSTIVPARRFGARPDTGTDMTTEIQAAFDQCPLGATLVFEPGTYVCTGFLSCARAINISAYGAVFDWGTTTFADTNVAFLYGGTSDATRSVNCTVTGLSIRRTEASNAVSDRKGIGFRWRSVYQSDIKDCSATNFIRGHMVSGSYNVTDGEEGVAYNTFTNLQAHGCRFGIWMDPGDSSAGPLSGWCNQNVFIGGRVDEQGMTGKVQSGDPAVAGSTAGIYFHKETNTHHDCNNNTFINVSIEGQWGRKLYGLGCRYNRFIDCRWELPHEASPYTNRGIYYYESDAVGQGNGTGYWKLDPLTNTFSEIPCTATPGYIKADIELSKGSGNWATDGNVITGGYDLWASVVALPEASSNVVENPHANASFAPQNTALWARTLYLGYRTGTATGGTGTEYPAQAVFRGNSSTPPLRLFNTSGGSPGQPILAILSAAFLDRIIFRDNMLASSAALGGMEFCDTTGALKNAFYLINSALGGTGILPLGTNKGLCINHGQADADSRVSGQTEVNLTYWDASTDRVGIGTATPDALHHVNGAQHVVGDAEIDGALNHDGTTVGFYGATPVAQSTGWSATNVTADTSFDANATSIDEIADVLGTLIDKLKALGLLGA